MKQGLAVSMIVKNEQAMIARAIESVKDADEIVILDTGSTDETEQVVMELELPNVQFVKGEYQWKDDFADARNFALAYCERQWILTLDADEYLEAGGVEKIRGAFDTIRQAKAFNLRVQAHGGQAWHDSPRVYRNLPEHVWHGAAHNYQNIAKAVPINVTLYYDHSPAHKADPFRTIRILSGELAKKPTDTRTLYYLGSEWLRKGNLDAAINYLELALVSEGNSFYAADTHLLLARCYWQKRLADLARRHCFHAIERNANFKEAILFMAEMSFERNAVRWRAMAEGATNEGVMFVRAV